MNPIEPESPTAKLLFFQLIDCQQQMLKQGVRRLLVLSGESDWAAGLVVKLTGHFSGDWLWVSSLPQPDFRTLEPEKVNQLLGQEFLHGVFDAREGLNAEALAAFSGVLQAGSWLILLAPAWSTWPLMPDNDSRRWSEQPEAIATPRFVSRFCDYLQQDKQTIIWRQGEACQPQLLKDTGDWFAPKGAPTEQQQSILNLLLQATEGIFVLTAARGRGKSTLAGMLVQQWKGLCWLTAPGKASARRIAEQSQQGARFFAPDALLAHCESGAPLDADWLLIDEAAAIPAPLLTRLIAFFPRVLLTTTVQGYEGTGRGFLLKFCASLAEWHDLRLVDPIRWAQHDPLETLINKILLFNEPDFTAIKNAAAGNASTVNAGASPEPESCLNAQITPLNMGSGLAANGEKQPGDKIIANTADNPSLMSFTWFDAAAWENDPKLLADFYHLLTSAHYRTSPIDLRRMLDAPGMSFSVAKRGEHLAAALWWVEEGGLCPALAHEVWAGRRRPRGNLVAQSMAAHGGFPEAAVLHSRRITRIAVAPEHRKQGVGRALVEQQRKIARAQGLDFLSVSFGFTDDLWRFWQRCGFKLVRVGNQREASSGCFAAMAILPLSASGQTFCQQAVQQFLRNSQQVPTEVSVALNQHIHSQDDSSLNDADWRELSGFAFASRSVESSRASLLRLLDQSSLSLPALRASLQSQMTMPEVISLLGLIGKKALLERWRAETRQALEQLDVRQCSRWRDFSE
ncbi:tRNA(Met) cytidine acetyltransferase TmcA [Serratia sp. M24T3]|uniref:tRNA(Met) cytidine acetyltransferase TmcA n=1 Tax=Serratia sp. M24T3 TaxID=932213 RepID=UPI00025BC3A8|nr:GNAT family N-acetyltransferase [Serratia sp. M24T3]EIC83003.1 N-acetyltransferase GCN5 [Serratia sp. M24T3]